MKIALIGTHGVPANYGGFETCAEELGARLVERGHEVTVYCRAYHIKHSEKYYRGMRLVKLPTIKNKYLETLFHTFLSCLHATTQGYDVALMFIAGNSPVAFIPRLVGQKVALNVDGLDWKRQKWPPIAKRYLKLAEFLATKFPNRVITDSQIVQEYYRQTYNADTECIAYGADIISVPPGECLKKFGLEPRRYMLFVGRLVPENCAHHLVEAFKGLDTEMKCVIVGDAPYEEKYIQTLKASAAPNVIFTGYQFGQNYKELRSNAYAFIESSEVGGTHPALLEAMAAGNCVVVNNTAENLETLGNAGLSYSGKEGASSLQTVLQTLLDNPELVQNFQRQAIERVSHHYNWEAITDRYEALCVEMLGAEVLLPTA